MRLDVLTRQAACLIDRLDARLLLQHVSGLSGVALIATPEYCLPPQQVADFFDLVHRRQRGEPLAYLIGHTGFYGRQFTVTPAVLIPRPDSELMIDQLLHHIPPDAPYHVLELGCGSGCLAITLARLRPLCRIVASDISPAALAVAQHNALQQNVAVDFVASDWFSAIKRTDSADPSDSAARFDVIFTNPPYVAVGDAHLLADGLDYEPALALTGSPQNVDGLLCLKHIISEAGNFLQKNGRLFVEHGYNQGSDCRRLFTAAGFTSIATYLDLGEHERVTCGLYAAA